MAIRLKDQVNLSTGLRNGESVLGEHAVHGSYYGLWNTEAISGTTQQYLIISAGTDTYINGDNVYIRAGNNSTSNQLKVTTSGTTIGGNTVLHAGNYTGYTDSKYLRSDAADTATGQLFFDAGFDSHPIMLSGAQNFDNIDRSGFYNLYNTHTNSTNSPGFPYGTMIAIGNDKGSQGFGLQIAHERTGTGMYVRGMNDTASAWSAWAEIWTSTTDGANSGLDADLLDGVQGASYLRSDTNDTFTGTLTLNGQLDLSSTDTAANYIHLPRGGGITMYGDTSAHHGIFSRNSGNSSADDILISSYNRIFFDLDSNNNNTNTEFSIVTHNGSTPIFKLSGETAHLTIGADDMTPMLDLMFDDHASGAGWDTRIQIGKSDDFAAGTGAFPTYIAAGAYGMQVQANSDGAFFGLEEYSSGNYRPVIQWGDDDSDTPFRIKHENGSELEVSYNGIVTATTRFSAPTLYSTVATGTSPLTVTSTTLVSNLNADLLDGIGGDGYLRSNTSDTFGSNSANQAIQFKVNSGQYIASGGSGTRFPIEVFAPTANGGDAAITFHISGDYAGYFGLASDWNDLAWGGWSVGSSTKYRILHTGNYSSWNRDDRYYTESEIDTKLGGKLGESTGAFGLSKKVDFYIYGDDDKYYPVIIDGGSAATLKRYQIYRGYSETAPSTWNTSTHKGSLTFDYEIRVGGWGGYTNMYSVNYFGEQYSRQCAKLAFANHTMQHVVWLRGGGTGGAIYHIESTANISVTPHYDTSASNYVSGTGWRTYDNSNDAYDTYYNYLDLGSTADSATQTTIVDHMFIKANGAVNENTGGGSFSSRFALLTGATFTGNVATPRLALGGAAFSSGEDLRVGGIRGRFSNELIHLYNRVNIGYPSGWGGQDAPNYGLSTYGGANLATNTGNVGIGETSPTLGLHVAAAKGALFGSSTGAGVYVSPTNANTINGGYGLDSDTGDLWLNYRGYQDGFTRFRDTRIGDGKGSSIVVVDGSAASVDVSGDIQTSAGSIRISDNWGQGFYGAEQLSIVGSYPSMTFRNNSQDHKWLIHHDGGSKLQFYEGADWDSNSWTKRMTFQNGTSGIDAYRFRDIENTDYYVEPASTSNLSGLTVVNNITGRINGLADRGFGDTELSFYQDSGALGSQWSSGWASHIICNHGNGSNYYNQIIHMPFWGPPQYSRMQGNTSNIVGRYDFCTNEASFTTTHTIQAGTLRATADVVAYYSSDKRLKDNIIPIGNAIDKIKQIGGYEFDWNDKQENFKGHDYGVIAQEVEKVLPELVKDREDGYKGVRYEKLTSVLIQGIKEQQDTIENQQKQIDELKDLVNQLINK